MKKNTGIISLIATIIVVIIIVLIYMRTIPKTIPTENILPQAYQNSTRGILFRYPTGFTLDETYTYQGFGPGKSISGIKLTIPSQMATGTNLSTDSYLSVEQVSGSQPCTPRLFLDQGRGGITQTITTGGITYLSASSTDAAAGNRYEEIVYTLPKSIPCTSVRYFIHYGAIENYPKDMVKQFDKVSLLKQFDTIRQTLQTQ